MDVLKLRKLLKKKKPTFRTTGFGERKSIKDRWRRPKGIDNKIRRNFKGYPVRVKAGFGSPKAARYLHPSGLKIVNVNNVNELSAINPKTEGVYISSAVGNKKRVEIIKKCDELKIKILNFKNAEDCIKKINEEMQIRKETKKKKSEDKEKKAAEKDKKETQETKEDKKDISEKIEEEKEKQKVLTKRE